MTTAWIGGRGFDLFFFFGSGLLSVAIGLLLIAVPSLVVPFLIMFLWFVDGPHIVATWARTYLDEKERARRGRLLAGSLLWLVPGFVAWGVARALKQDGPFALYLGFATIWSIHHAIRQNYGILALYEGLAKAPETARKLDSQFLYASLWGTFLVALITLPVNRKIMGFPTVFPLWAQRLTWASEALLATIALAYAVVLIDRLRKRLPVRPGLFAWAACLGTFAFAYFIVGPFEPLVHAPQNPEQTVIVMTIVGGTLHGVQYLGIVIAANRRRFAAVTRTSLVARSSRHPLYAYAGAVALSFGYVALNAARGAIPSASLFSQEDAPGQLFLAFYWGMFMHHYYLDQKIWRVGRDPELQFELGLRGAP